MRWILHQVEDVTAVRVDLMRALEFYRGELADDHGNDTNRARRSTEYAAVSLSPMPGWSPRLSRCVGRRSHLP